MRLWIDTDMGFDDIAALGLCRFLGAEITGISLVAGNAPLDQVIENSINCLDAFGWDIPIYAGADCALNGERQTADYVLGETGIRTVRRPLPAARAPKALAKVSLEAALTDYLENENTVVLALGPLTNLARFVQNCPELAAKMQVVWMGGAFARGNHSAVAEFNAAIDPEAINVVLESGCQLTMVALECCRDVSAGLEVLPVFRENPSEGSQLIADLYEAYLRIAANGLHAMAIYDPVAAALALRPDWARYNSVHMVAETHGLYTRGMTVVEWRNHKATPNVNVAYAPDSKLILSSLHAAFAKMVKEYDANH